MGVSAPTPTVAKIEASSSEGNELDMTLTAGGTCIFAIEYRVLQKRILSTSGHVDMRPLGVRWDRTFAHEDATGASDMNQQQTEIIMDEDTLADIDEEAEEQCITIQQ